MSSEPGVFLSSFTSFFDHGLLVLEDVSSQAKHEEWDAHVEAVHLDTDSLYVGVCPSVDGPVTVSVYETEQPPGAGLTNMAVLFSGQLPVRSGLLVISDSDDTVKLTFRKMPGSYELAVYANASEIPTEVVVVIRRLR